MTALSVRWVVTAAVDFFRRGVFLLGDTRFVTIYLPPILHIARVAARVHRARRVKRLYNRLAHISANRFRNYAGPFESRQLGKIFVHGKSKGKVGARAQGESSRANSSAIYRTHAKRLALKIDETVAFLDALIVVRGEDGRLWTIIAFRRLPAQLCRGARINPVRFHKLKKGETKPPMPLAQALTRMATARREF
jgi:hypothetical protein